MALPSNLVESIKQTALSLDRSVVRLGQDPENEDQILQVGDLIESIRDDLDRLEEWVDGGCPVPIQEEQ